MIKLDWIHYLSWKLSFLKIGGIILEIDNGCQNLRNNKRLSQDMQDLCHGEAKKKKKNGQLIRRDIDKDLNVQTWKIIGWLWMIQEYQYCAYHCIMNLHVIEFNYIS